jgi:hypothetical protein
MGARARQHGVAQCGAAMTSLIVPPLWASGQFEFAQLAIPSVVLLLIAIALRTMLTYSRGAHITRVKQAATLVIVPLSVIFIAAMSFRITSTLGQ